MKIVAVLSVICLSAGAFSPLLNTREISNTGAVSTHHPLRPSSAIFAGFGDGGAKKAKAGKSSTKQGKLKPKQQWGRYSDLKKETKIAVGIRLKEDDSDEWLQVGYVRSKGSEYTTMSVALQRALIAEHAKRLYPLQVSAKKTMEWACKESEKDEWSVVDKSILDGATLPEGIEKMIGFEGTPDPATGFYCIYDGGKLKVGEESSFK